MPNDKFKYEKATVTIRAKRGSDELDFPWILHDLVQMMVAEQKLKDADDLPLLEWGKVSWFVDILLRSEIKGKLGFVWPDYKVAATEEIYKAYQSLMKGSPELVKAWKNASRRANLEIVDPEDLPDAQKS